MHQEKKNLTFCSSTEENTNSKTGEFLHDYYWSLEKYSGQSRKLTKRIKTILPQENLGNGITIGNVLVQLNSNTENFDFEYKPSEMDCLKIYTYHSSERIQYFKVKYINNKWIKGGNVITAIMERIARGKIK
ncbi:hypothetical protein [Winogradskyella sp.]|uniref:hypothetical protein n=1 Tax=Winogradskyella sp. TaxID=1883156 RepID=UPI003BA85620